SVPLPRHPGDSLHPRTPVVSGHGGPLRLRGARHAYGIADVLPRRAGDVLPLRLVGAAGFRARERAADVELVSLLDREPAHDPKCPIVHAYVATTTRIAPT